LCIYFRRHSTPLSFERPTWGENQCTGVENEESGKFFSLDAVDNQQSGNAVDNFYSLDAGYEDGEYAGYEDGEYAANLSDISDVNQTGETSTSVTEALDNSMAGGRSSELQNFSERAATSQDFLR
jgi:hypothetical protein